MQLIQSFVLHSLQFNMHFTARHVPGMYSKFTDFSLPFSVLQVLGFGPKGSSFYRCPRSCGALKNGNRLGGPALIGAIHWGTFWLVHVDAVTHFLCVHLHEAGLCAATIANLLPDVSFASKSVGCSHSCSDFRSRKALQGWACEETPTLQTFIS